MSNVETKTSSKDQLTAVNDNDDDDDDDDDDDPFKKLSDIRKKSKSDCRKHDSGIVCKC